MDFAKELLGNGRVIMPVRGTAALTKLVALGFENFLQIVPPEERAKWSFNVAGNEDPDGSPDDGFIMRKGEARMVSGGRYDEKFLFHYRPRLERLLRERGIDFGAHQRWFDACRGLYRLAYTTMAELGTAIDKEMPGYKVLERMEGIMAREANVVRIIQYSARGPEDPLVIGKKHADRNFLTLQIGESQPGLRVYSDDVPIPYEAVADHVLVFASQKFELLTDGKIKAVQHDVVNKNPTAPARWSVIFFGHIFDTFHLPQGK